MVGLSTSQRGSDRAGSWHGNRPLGSRFVSAGRSVPEHQVPGGGPKACSGWSGIGWAIIALLGDEEKVTLRCVLCSLLIHADKPHLDPDVVPLRFGDQRAPACC